MTPYDETFDPPAPVLDVLLVNSSEPSRQTRVKGLIDTGSDLTALPQSAVSELGLRKRGRIPLTGVNGLTIEATTFLVDLVLGDLRLERRLVTVWSGEFVVIGRDSLVDLQLTLDGKARRFDLRDP